MGAAHLLVQLNQFADLGAKKREISHQSEQEPVANLPFDTELVVRKKAEG